VRQALADASQTCAAAQGTDVRARK